MIIKSVFEAYDYQRAKKPGMAVIHRFLSKSKHAGPEGVTHFLSIGKSEVEYLGMRSYWWSTAIRPPGWTGILDRPQLLPARDLGSEGETIRDDMIESMKEYLENGKDPDYVIVMKWGDIYHFKSSKIINYIDEYQTWIQHRYYEHSDAAAGYPNRLADRVMRV